MRRLAYLAIAFGMLVATAGAAIAQSTGPQPGCQFVEETDQEICEPFLGYWEMHGGVENFGYPLTTATDELNLDLQRELETQYFERGRLEVHPANAGTPYGVELGRLGNEVLLELGRDWHTFPEGDPNADNYFPETGHAIAPEFRDYWSDHGLDLGDAGVSLREALALFGYPLSEAEVETNLSGDSVLTQWFERARFELHDEGIRLGLLGSELLDLRAGEEPQPPGAVEVIAAGLENPRGLTVGPDDAVYVTEGGTAGDECQIASGTDGSDVEICFGATSVVTLIADGTTATAAGGLSSMRDIRGDIVGAQDTVIGENGTVYAIVGLGADPSARADFPAVAGQLGHIVSLEPDGEIVIVADIAAYEAEANPAGGALDSNPYSLAPDGAGGWVVSDAGMNALLHLDTGGTMSTLAVFEDRMVVGPDGSEVPMQAVPTGVVQGPDGAFYVGELTGFPFEPGAARVWRVTLDGESEVYAEGFTNIIDVAFDDAGNLYVLEMIAGGLLNADPEDPASLKARLVMVAPDGSRTTIASDGLAFATGLAIAPGPVDTSTLYVSNLGVMPGMGQVVMIAPE